MVILVEIDTPCGKKKFQNFSSENHRFFREFLISMLKSDPLEPKRKKIQKTLLMIKCPKL